MPLNLHLRCAYCHEICDDDFIEVVPLITAHPDCAEANAKQAVTKHSLTETLARQLFIAELGHTGLTWDQLDREFGQGDYRDKAGRVLEGWFDPDKPLVILDLANDEMWLERSR